MKETHLVQQVIQYLNFKGHYAWRNNTGGLRGSYTYKKGEREGMTKAWFMRFGFPGISDIIGCSKDGKFIAIECKIKPNKPTALQEAYLEEIRKRGGVAIVAYDLSDVEAVL